jgi:hypothetical protein
MNFLAIKTNPTFPHESMADQFFSESQFESYRMLGAYTMENFAQIATAISAVSFATSSSDT